MKKILFIMLLIFFIIGIGCKHHSHHHYTPNITPDPAAFTYTAQEVAQHQPGFFSCCNANGPLFLGTYEVHNGGHGTLRCQLCRLDGNKITVLKTFRGESVYNIRFYGNYLMLPIEQGDLWRYDIGKSFSIVHPKHLRMGHYDFHWTPFGWVTSEKDTITANNHSQLWENGKLLYESSDFTWKEFVTKNDKAYVGVYFVWKHTEAGLLEVNLRDGKANLLHSERWGNYTNVGKYNNRICYSIQFGKTSKIFWSSDSNFQEIPDIVWRFKPIGDTFFLLAAENGWRKGGPCYIYVYSTVTKKFIKVLTLPDAEPWDITKGVDDMSYYFVTRNESGNIGRVYLIRRH